jgi:hypothetical protein
VPGQRRGTEHPGDPSGRGAGGGQQLHAPSEGLHRLGDELGQADHRDQLTDRETALQREPAGDARDHREEEAVHRRGEAEVQALGVGGTQRDVQGVAARGGIAPGGAVLRTDAAQHPQPGDEIDGQIGGLGECLLLGLTAAGEQRREPLQTKDHQRYADQHSHSDPDVDDQQRHGRDHDGGQCRGGRAGGPHHQDRQLGVRGRDGE